MRAYLAGLAVAVVFWAIARLMGSYFELVDFKSSTTQQSAVNDARIAITERLLTNEQSKIESELNAAVERIDTEYGIALSHGVHQSTASSHVQVPTDTRAPQSAPADAQGKSPAGSKRVPEVQLENRLSRCQARVLYEAREYDILATHYNALLRLYEQARQVTSPDKGRKAPHETGH